MTPQRVRALMESLPEGKNEIYFHPATWRGETLRRLMPDYEHEAELQALITTNAMISPRMVAEPR